MDIIIQNSGDTPIYQQLYDQIRLQIMQGILVGGSMLPSIRTVAKELRISVITVKKAWEELERDGLIISQAGKGCFVRELQQDTLTAKKEDMLQERMRRELEYYKTYGLGLDELIELVKKSF